MKRVILGTAGHIDHGKTTLIKTLTGINTDRLKEERLRGITIELGFASFSLPCGQNLGIIDVPGHEKFVKNMVAGAMGIDILAMVIAADEGVMPQTKEHMEICSLLGIKYGLVVLTKIDMISPDWMELVQEDIHDLVNNTFLEKAPIIPVSSITGEGIDVLTKTIAEIHDKIPPRSFSEVFRLPVDRVFTIKGFGTVVTGTIVSGKIKVGSPVMIYPYGVKSKVRGIQVHNKNVIEATAGMRTAINFQGLGKNEVERGNIIAYENALNTSYMLDVSLEFLKSNIKPVKNRTKIRLHTGTSEIMGNIILIDRDSLSPGDSCFAQIRLESPVAVVKNDSFVIRSYSPVRTIGGGKILNPFPKKQKRFLEKTMMGFQTLKSGSSCEIIDHHTKLAGIKGISFDELIIATQMPVKSLSSEISSKLSRKEIIKIGKDNYIHASVFELVTEHIVNILKNYHKKNPIKAGIPKGEMKSKLPFGVDSKLYILVLSQMEKNNRIIVKNDSLRLPGHSVELRGDQEKIKKQIATIYQANKLTPPYFKEVVKNLGIARDEGDSVLDLLVKEKTLVKIKQELFCHKATIDDLEQKLRDFLKKEKEITTPQFKSMTQVSRKYTIPLIEYFDFIKVTIRIGDVRRLRH